MALVIHHTLGGPSGSGSPRKVGGTSSGLGGMIEESTYLATIERLDLPSHIHKLTTNVAKFETDSIGLICTFFTHPTSADEGGSE